MVNAVLAKLSVVGGVFISLGVAVFVGLVVGFFALVPVSLWIRSIVSNAHISMKKLAGMRLRKVKLGEIIVPYIQARKAGIFVDLDELETHVIAGGSAEKVVKALVSARSANIDLSFQTAKTIDLAGKDVYEAIKTCVVPKVIETGPISGIAKDEIEIRTKAKITVRSNIHRLIGGAGEDTIVARVAEGIVSTIGSAVSHHAVLENPDLISNNVLSKGLDSGTSFEIVSIDISEVEVGKNIGAQFKMDQAELDRRISQANAEERRVIAVALEQEMRAKVQEKKAAVIEAEADIPKAISKALASGKMTAADYYNIQNLQADTKMRNAISEKDDKKNFDF